MTFEDLMKISSEQDFLLKEGNATSRDYLFENSEGNHLHIKSLSTSANETLPMWTVDVDGDRVQFDNPTQLLAVNTIVTGLITRSIKVLQQKVKEENNEQR